MTILSSSQRRGSSCNLILILDYARMTKKVNILNPLEAD